MSNFDFLCRKEKKRKEKEKMDSNIEPVFINIKIDWMEGKNLQIGLFSNSQGCLVFLCASFDVSNNYIWINKTEPKVFNKIVMKYVSCFFCFKLLWLRRRRLWLTS